MYEKKIWIQQENSYKINFPATQLSYTKYVRNTKNYLPPQQKKTNITPQLYGTLST